MSLSSENLLCAFDKFFSRQQMFYLDLKSGTLYVTVCQGKTTTSASQSFKVKLVYLVITGSIYFRCFAVKSPRMCSKTCSYPFLRSAGKYGICD